MGSDDLRAGGAFDSSAKVRRRPAVARQGSYCSEIPRSPVQSRPEM